MNFFTRKRLISILIACLMLLQCFAAVAEQALVLSDSAVYVYSNGIMTPAGSLPAGTMVQRVAENNGFSMISVNGGVGFMQSGALGALQNWYGCTAYATAAAPLYQSFSTASAVIATVPAGAAVSVAATAGSWAGVSYNGMLGFMDVSALTTQAPAAQQPQQQVMTGYAAVNGAKVYNNYGAVIGTLPLNTAISVHAVNSGLCLVERGGYYAVMLQSELSATPVAAPQVQQPAVPSDNGVVAVAPTTVYVKTAGAKVYSPSGSVIGTLAMNTALTMDARTDALARVSNGSAAGLMLLSDLSTTPVAVTTPSVQPTPAVTEISPAPFYVKNAGAKVMDANGRVLATLGLNAVVTVNAYTDTLARVVNGSTVGFMQKSDLSASPAYTAPAAPVAPTAPAAPAITEISPATFYVQKNGASVLDGSGKVIATLNVNTPVIVNAYTDSLARVVNGSTVGFMLKSDLGSAQVAVSYTLKYGDSGDAVKRVQTRLQELGYFHGSIGGNFLDLTRAAVSAFQYANGLTQSGECDQNTLTALFAETAKKNPALQNTSGSGSTGETYANGSTAQPATGTAQTMDWWKSGIQSIFSRGTVAVVTDVATGIAWHETRTGGTNHADVQPTTAADTAAMKKAVGSWSWNRRAIFVTINGVNYAASMNAMPHGGDSIASNNFDGHHCIHFTNSRTHGSNKVCSLHQSAIKKAASTTL